MSSSVRLEIKRFLYVLIIYLLMSIPFKTLPIIPGVTDLRPVNAITLLAGMFAGPTGALACACGNLISDFFGTLSPYSAVGFVANFVGACLPYYVWHYVKENVEPSLHTLGNNFLFITCCVYSSSIIALSIGMAYDLGGTGIAAAVTHAIFQNQVLFTVFLGMPLLAILTCGVFNIPYKEAPKRHLLTSLPNVFFGKKKKISLRDIIIHTLLTGGAWLSLALVVLTGFLGFSYSSPIILVLTVLDLAAAVVLCL